MKRALLTVIAVFTFAVPTAAQVPLGDAVERLFGPQGDVAPQTDTRRILQGFTPEVERLSPITGQQMRDTYTGRTLKGIYFEPFLSEQRFVETFSEDGRTTTYTEGDFGDTGEWAVAGDVICYRYPNADPGRRHCFREYSYGNCLVSYPANIPTRDNGLPMFPATWNSVSVFVEDGFEWPDVPASEAEAFTCESLLS